MRRSSKRRSSRRAISLLTPNAPIDRLKYIVKTYGEKQPWVVLDTLSVIFNTIGIDRPLPELQKELLQRSPRQPEMFERLRWVFWTDDRMRGGLVPLTLEFFSRVPYQRQLHYWWFGDPELAVMRPISRRPGSTLNEVLLLILELVDSPDFANGAMREPSDADGIFPWVARELSKLSKYTIGKGDDRYHLDHNEYVATLDALRRSGNLIAQWAKANRIDLMKMSLAEVMEASKGFRVKKKVEHGEVVYKFKSGWTIESLKGKKQLDCEGDFLSHCAYSYRDAVDQGRSVIYSLRDPDGVPYVTMEWKPWREGNPRSPEGYRWDGYFAQVFGQRNAKIGSDEFAEYVFSAGQDNEPPLTRAEVPEVVEAIRAMVVEFIDKVKDGELTGLALAGGLRGRDMRGADLRGAFLNNADMRGANLSNTDMRGTRLLGAILRDADLSKANLSGAHLSGADMRGANLSGADLSRTGMPMAELSGARYTQETVWPSRFDPVEAGVVLVTDQSTP
jgi:hypothetical protein